MPKQDLLRRIDAQRGLGVGVLAGSPTIQTLSTLQQLLAQNLDISNNALLLRTALLVGRLTGGHVGLRRTWNQYGLLEATDMENVPYFSVGLDLTRSLGQWLRLGYETEPGISLQTVPGYDLPQMRVDPACVIGLDHATLTHLSYADAGHTGFEPTISKGDLAAGSSKIILGGTGAGALIGVGASVDVVEGNITHNNLGGLTTGDPHTQYLLKALADVKGDLLAATAVDTWARVPVGTDGKLLMADAASAAGVKWADVPVSSIDHNALTNLAVGDVHTHYALLAGRAGGQTLYGGNAANDDITIEPTSHATKTTAYLLLAPSGGNVGIGTTAPAAMLHGIKTTEQLRLGYDASNYYSTTVSSAGRVTLDAVGTGAAFQFNDNLAVGYTPDASIIGYFRKTLTDVGNGGTGVYTQPVFELTVNSTYTYYGVYANAYGPTTHNLGSLYGGRFAATHRAAGTLTSIFGLSGSVVTSGTTGAITSANALDFYITHGGSGTISAARGIQLSLAHTGGAITSAAYINLTAPSGGGTIGTAYGIYIQNLATATTTNAYGIFINAQSGAATLNYALYTAAGLHRFGDQLTIAGSADRVQLSVTGHSTQSANVADLIRNDGATNTVNTVLRLAANSTGTPAGGFGSRLLWSLESSTTADQSAAAIDTLWQTATHVNAVADQVFYTGYHNGAAIVLGEWLRGRGGANPAIGLYGATPVVRATTAGSAATFAQNSGNAVNDASTFDGYTLLQIVLALRNIGILT